MDIDEQIKTDKEDKPLTRADVERLLQEVGSSERLSLRNKNLKNINLAHFDLTKADLREAILEGAILVGANLSKTNLSRADLSLADLREADLRGAILVGAVLHQADLSKAILNKANLSGANLKEANLSKVTLIEASLNGADLSSADLSLATLTGATLDGVKLIGAILNRTYISPESEKDILRGINIIISGTQTEEVVSPSTLHIRILEEPLTAQNLTSILLVLTELSTKYWLIAKGRFADLIEYTQTHNGRFAEEAGVILTKVRYNSPFNMDWKVDLSAPSVAEALVTTIDGVTHAPKRLKQKELENQAKAQEIKYAEQQADHEQQMAVLEQEQRRLEIEKQRLEVLEKQLEVQKKGIEYALEIARKVVDLLHPDADSAARAMEIQALLPNLVQLQNGKGLELALPVSRNEKPMTSNEDE